MHRLFAGLLFLGALLLPTSRIAAQPVDTLSARAEVSLLTILPGDAVYSMFGHSAFRVHDPVLGIDRVYNYGTFSFESFLFLPKFLYGNLRYYLSVVPYHRAIRHYRVEERPVIEQTLNLTPPQEQAVSRFLQINARPENRYYRYDFFFDNCSTRIRDVLEAVLEDTLQFTGAPDPHETFRHLLDPYGSDYLNLGMDLFLGPRADRMATPRQVMFLPDYLMAAFDEARVRRAGQWQPLVAYTDTTLWIAGYERAEASAFPPMLLGWVLFACGLAATALAYRRGHLDRPLPDALLLFVIGLVGLVMIFLTFVSTHEPTAYNLNLLWAWPTHLWAAAALLRGRHKKLLRRYLTAAAAVCLVVALGWPLWPQDLPAAAFPIVLLLVLRCGWQAYVLRSHVPTSAVRPPAG